MLGGLLLKVWTRRRRRHRRGRLPGRRPAAVPRLGAPGRRARPDRQPSRPGARRARLSASRAPAVGSGLAAGRGAGRRLPALEAGRGRRAVRRDARAGAALPGSPRRPPARAGAGAVQLLAGRRARRLGRSRRSGRQAAGRLHHRRALGRFVPVGLPVHGDRGRAAGARVARLRARAARRRRACAGGRGRRGPAVRLAAAVAGGDVRDRARGRGARRAASRPDAGAAVRDLALPLAATAAPLAYYALLGHFDSSWALAARVNELPRWSWWVLLAGLAPLAVPALFAYRLPAPDFGAAALRAWPLAALAVYFQPFGTFPFHALQGLTPPLVVLGMLALRAHIGERPLPLVPALAVVALLVLVGTAYRVAEPRRRRAHRPPAVHARAAASATRCAISTRCPSRAACSPRSTAGSRCPPTRGARPGSARARGRRTSPSGRATPRRCSTAGSTRRRRRRWCAARGARFVLSDCHGRADISQLLAGFTDPPRRFGCATRLEGPVIGCGGALRARRLDARDRGAGDPRLPRRLVTGALDATGSAFWYAQLNVGVPLFFAISGFLLYRPWVAARLAGVRPPEARVYALRRAAADRAGVLGGADGDRARARARRRVLLAGSARPLRLPPGVRPRALHGRHRAGVDADGRGRVLRRAAADRAGARGGSRAGRRRGSCAGSWRSWRCSRCSPCSGGSSW